ncbi:MAG: phytoene desaturase [Crocinitomicaceae bacterium]|nr:phytoene desaturase [Crocinitomicaceae bacterium]
MKKAIVIGAGVGGLGAAVRLANLGYQVKVFEANGHAGGKMNNLQLGDFRFDMGPSIFTGPEYVKELYDLCGEPFNQFPYQKLEQPFNYFFEDGTTINLKADKVELVNELSEKLGESKKKLRNYLKKCEKNYQRIAPLFIEKSLHRWQHLLNKKLWKALVGIPRYKLHQTMHQENAATFNNPKTHQIFNRFATYNGSNPYQAPAMLNMIQHLEMNVGVFLPENGMVQIARSLQGLAQKQGALFHFQEKVKEIHLDNNKVVAVSTDKGRYEADVVYSNMDVHLTYDRLLPNFEKVPKKILNQERSSSAIVFYWGINDVFPELTVHNLFFSDEYEKEFKDIFEYKTIGEDPSIYVHITSKIKSKDAPKNAENWFVMINAPIDIGQDWEVLKVKTKEVIINKLERVLKRDIRNKIVEEFVMDAPFIADTYSGKNGSIYGNASNNAFAAFYRHPNFSKNIEGLYFVGVSVHPGGGIPLALNSAKIAVTCMLEDQRKK